MQGTTSNSAVNTESKMQNTRMPLSMRNSQFGQCLERLRTSNSLSKYTNPDNDSQNSSAKTRKGDASDSSGQEASKSKAPLDDKKALSDTDTAVERGPGSFVARHLENQLVILESPARSILHVADFERIVAQIRTQKTVDSASVLIKLNNSVFEGLEMRVSLKEGGGLTAEFIAINEAIKTSIESRSAELIRMFADRGIELGSLSVSVGSEKRDNSGLFQNENPQKSNPALEPNSLEVPVLNDGNLHFSGTSYLT